MIIIFGITCVKWWYLQAFFPFFWDFIFWAVTGIKGQKMAQDDKKSVCCSSYLRNHVSYDCHLWYMHLCKMILSLGYFFHFFKILILWVVKGGAGVNGQKMVQNEKKLCHAPYLMNHIHMILIYGTHVENDNISRMFFHFFKILIFWIARG